MKKIFYILSIVTLISTQAWSLEVSSQGEFRLESRAFKDDGIDTTQDYGYGVFSRLEAAVKSEKNQVKLKVSVVGRVGRKDSERNVFYFEDAYLEKDFGSTQIFAGLRLVNWSTAEAFHPSDIINSRNFDTQFENAEKIGEPMLGFASQFGDFGVQAFYMPALRGPKFTSSQNRVSFFPAGINVREEAFVDQSGETQEDWASQWAVKSTLSKWGGDWSLYWVHHFDRSQPLMNIVSPVEATPVFVEMDQIGLNLQQQVSDFMVKLELAHRIFDEGLISDDFGLLPYKSHSLLAGGLEYIYGWDAGSETTFLLEAQFAEGLGRADRQAVNLFQRDALIGFRHAFNDAASKEIFLIAIADLEISKQLMISASYSQRLKSEWKIKVGGRYVDAPTDQIINIDLRTFNQDHQLYFELSRFF